jgi:hypothetical protein
MGIGHSADLTLVANLTLEFLCFTFAFTLVTCRRSWASSFLAPFTILLYHVIVRTGAQIQDPLQGYVGQAKFDANRILNIVLVSLGIVGFSQLAWFWFHLLGMREWMPLRRKIPNIVAPRAQKVLTEENGVWSIRDVYEKRVTPRAQWGIAKSGPSWMYLVITALYVFGALCGSQVVYDQYILRTGRELTAWLVRLLVPLGIGVIIYFYDRYRPDTYVFGPSVDLLTGNKYMMDASNAAVMQAQTRDNVNWTVLPVVFLDFINVLVMGAVRVWTPNADNNWLFGVGLFALHLLLMIVVFFGMRFQSSSANKAGVPQALEPIDDSGNYYDDLASQQVPLAQVRSKDSAVMGGDGLGRAMMAMGSKSHVQ